MAQCDIVLVYIWDGIFGKLEPIRGPASIPKTGKEPPLKLPTPPKASIDQTMDTYGEQKQKELVLSDRLQPAGITQSTFATDVKHDNTDVTPESANAPHTEDRDKTRQQAQTAAGARAATGVIPDNVDESLQVATAAGHADADTPVLPSIRVFLSKTCTIPLIRCNFEQIKKTVEQQTLQDKGETVIRDQTREENRSTNTSQNTAVIGIPTEGNSGAEIHTSSRKRTIIDYKKFLEEYADEPPSPKKKKKEIDLKQKPSKTRLAAEKYSCSKNFTKPTYLPRPVRRKKTKVDSPVASGSMEGQMKRVNATANSKTITVPATSSETQDAIEALLLLGNPPEEPLPDLEDNEILMPISKPQQTDPELLPNVPSDANPPIPPEPLGAAPKPGTLLGVAVKTDQNENPTVTDDHPDDENPTVADDQPDDADDNGDPQTEGKNGKKKTFVTKEYGLKRRVKTKRKFKCGACDAELVSVRDYNQHYLDNHPPTPCPHCPRLLSSPSTMAKHKYSHDEIMYECENCGRGFTFKSQYNSHRRVHLKIQGYVCFKANCGQRFKRESELNAHLKAHTSKPISCEYCDYKNTDKRNVRAHMRVHSDELPFFCILCGKRFKWQEQKKRHLPNCPGD